MPATSTIQISDSGIRTFQPSFMNWSYRRRGSVPRSQTNTAISSTTLPRNHNSGHQPVLNIPSLIVEIGQGARQPPRNNVVAIAETLTMLMYSAMNGIAYLNDEYSVPHPATSSPSASGRSNGARFVSPTIEMR